MNSTDTGQQTYAVAFIPADPIYSEVKQISQYIRKQYRSGKMQTPEPRIPIINGFNWSDSKEYLLIDALKRFASQQFPIDIDLQHFGYKRNENIFIRLVQENEIKKLRMNLMNHFDTTIRVEYNDTDTQNFEPYVSIGCENLPKTTVNRAWNEFKDRHFEASFIGSRLALIKKHDATDDVVAEFDLC